MKFLSIFIALTAALATGCSNTHPVSKTTSVVTVTARPHDAMDDIFLRVLRDGTDSFDHASDSKVVKLAHVLCGLWDDGQSLDSVFSMLYSVGYSAQESGFFVGAATQAYCPQYDNLITG